MGLAVYLLNTALCFNHGRKIMDKEKKKTAPSKKELIKDIENLDKNKLFDTTSLGRTNIANLLALKTLLS